MNIVQTASNVTKIAKDKSPALLIFAGLVGMAASVLMVNKVAPKADDILEDLEEKDATPVEKVKAVAPLYFPAAFTFAASTACIIGSYKISTNRIASYATAYTITEHKLEEYQRKVIETIGSEKEEEIRKEIVRDHMDENSEEQKIFNVDDALMDGKQLFWDDFTRHYFRCTQQELFDAKERINIALDIDTSHGCREVSINEWLEQFEDLDKYCDSKWNDYGWYPGDKLYMSMVPHICEDGITSCIGIVLNVNKLEDIY